MKYKFVGQYLSTIYFNCDLPQSTLINANAVTKLLQWVNFQEQKNSHPYPLPSIQSWGICCFVQVI